MTTERDTIAAIIGGINGDDWDDLPEMAADACRRAADALLAAGVFLPVDISDEDVDEALAMYTRLKAEREAQVVELAETKANVIAYRKALAGADERIARAEAELAEARELTAETAVLVGKQAIGIKKVSDLHQPYIAHGSNGCDTCRVPWPCPTAEALEIEVL